MRRTLKKNAGCLTPVTLLANLGIALCLTAATTLLVEPACIGEAASVELGVGALVLISETEPEVFFESSQYVSERVGRFAACVPRRHGRQTIIPLTDYDHLLANTLCFDIPPPVNRRSYC